MNVVDLIFTNNQELEKIIKDIPECRNFTNKLLNGLREFLFEEKNKTESNEIKELLQFAFLTRINILQENTVPIFMLINDDKISIHKSTNLTMHINSFYTHLSGLIDNVAWLIEYKYKILNVSIDDTKGRNKIGITDKKIELMKNLKINNIKVYNTIMSFNTWFKDLKDKRDPIVHRKPLYIPPGKITNNNVSFTSVFTLDNKEHNIEKFIINDLFQVYKLIIELFYNDFQKLKEINDSYKI